jgi:hypothetical protein
MPLAMSRPWKHPRSGVYYLRKGVPEDLRELVGKVEEKRSLGTRDPAEAKRRHAEALADVEVRWANLRAGPRALTEREAHQLAVTVHDRWLQQHQENPSKQTAWNVDLADRLFAAPRRLKSYDISDPDFEGSMDEDSRQISGMEKWCFEIADECLVAHGLRVDEPGRRVLAGAVAAALQRASLTLASLAKGGIPSANFFSTAAAQLPVVSRQPVVFKQLVEGWAAERRPVAKTQYEWSRVVRQLEAYLGHSDAHRLTGENLVDWKRSMVETGLRPKTIQDAKLAPLRAILQWGVQNKLIPSNPADGISLDVRSKQGEKKRSFNKRTGVPEFTDLTDIPAPDETLEELEAADRRPLRIASGDSLLRTFKRCHDYLYGNQNMRGDRAFWQILYLIFAKILDERSTSREFFVGATERNSDKGQRDPCSYNSARVRHDCQCPGRSANHTVSACGYPQICWRE